MDRPIIFNSEMVRAILDGRKTQTRRVIKPQPNYQKRFGQPESEVNADIAKRKCPYGKVGDRLWVQETLYRVVPAWIGKYKADGKTVGGDLPLVYPWKCKVLSGRFMPKSCARIWLEITKIRVERVQDISEEDAKAEGVEPQEIKHLREIAETIPDSSYCPHKLTFSELWDSINEKRGYGWDVNPWCWCISFKKVKNNCN